MTPKITWTYHLNGNNLYRSRKWGASSRRYYRWCQRYYISTDGPLEFYGGCQWIPCTENQKELETVSVEPTNIVHYYRVIYLPQYCKQYELKEVSPLAVLVATGIDVRKMQ